MDSFCGVADLKEEESSASKIGCNAVVLRSIARASDFATLKSLRQVSSFWAQAVSRVFTQRASVNLKPGERSLKSLLSFKKDTKGIEGKLKVLKIHCNFEGKLELEEGTAFNDILQHLSSSLEMLELAPQNIHCHIVFYPRIESKAQFPVLVTLDLANITYDTPQFVCKLFEATPALETLKLGQLSYPEHDNFSLVLSPLQIIGEDGSISRNWDLAPNLRSLSVFITLSAFEAEGLAAFPQTWEVLNLSWNSSDELELVGPALEQLLEKNKKRLLYLTLQDVCCNAEPQTKVHFQFPRSFSNLKELYLCFEGWGSGSDSTFDHITFSFGRSKDLIEYSKMCPSLYLIWIVVKLQVGTELKGIWSKFFPQFLSREGGNHLKWVVESRGSRERREVLVAGRVVDPSNNNIWENILGIGSVAAPQPK